MKTQNLLLNIEQLAKQVADTLRENDDPDTACNLKDALEYLRRTYHALEGVPFEDEDTTIETQRWMRESLHGVEDSEAYDQAKYDHACGYHD